MAEPRELPSSERLPYIKGLIFLARAGGGVGEPERAQLLAAIDACALAPADADAARAAIDAPLALAAVAEALAGSQTRFALYLDAIALAYADGVVVPAEEEALDALRDALGLQGYEAQALRQVAESLQALKTQPKPDAAAVTRTKEALARLAAVGVPIGAAAVSGTVQGLSAAALTSGLAALGLGLGVTGGVGVCLLLGLASYQGVKWLLRKTGRKPSKPAP
ncbi:MAG TPA: DUF533 domain-containing protein [Polyangia bacterium]|jgi:hypothetical protein